MQMLPFPTHEQSGALSHLRHIRMTRRTLSRLIKVGVVLHGQPARRREGVPHGAHPKAARPGLAEPDALMIGRPGLNSLRSSASGSPCTPARGGDATSCPRLRRGALTLPHSVADSTCPTVAGLPQTANTTTHAFIEVGRCVTAESRRTSTLRMAHDLGLQPGPSPERARTHLAGRTVGCAGAEGLPLLPGSPVPDPRAPCQTTSLCLPVPRPHLVSEFRRAFGGHGFNRTS